MDNCRGVILRIHPTGTGQQKAVCVLFYASGKNEPAIWNCDPPVKEGDDDVKTFNREKFRVARDIKVHVFVRACTDGSQIANDSRNFFRQSVSPLRQHHVRSPDVSPNSQLPFPFCLARSLENDLSGFLQQPASQPTPLLSLSLSPHSLPHSFLPSVALLVVTVRVLPISLQRRKSQRETPESFIKEEEEEEEEERTSAASRRNKSNALLSLIGTTCLLRRAGKSWYIVIQKRAAAGDKTTNGHEQ